jgi:hypothetical protein
MINSTSYSPRMTNELQQTSGKSGELNASVTDKVIFYINKSAPSTYFLSSYGMLSVSDPVKLSLIICLYLFFCSTCFKMFLFCDLQVKFQVWRHAPTKSKYNG